MKKEINHDVGFEDTLKDRKEKWLDFVENDVLHTTFCYARYSKRMEVVTGLGNKIV